MTRSAKGLLRLLAGFALLAGAAIAHTQEEAPQAAGELDPAGPGGITTLIFLLGVTGILVVGGIHVARESFRQDDEARGDGNQT